MTTERRTRPTRRGPGMTQAILAVAVVALAAACGGGRGGRTGTTTAPPSPASRRPGTTVAAISKPCLSAAEQERTFRFRTGSGTTLVGLALGRGRSGLVLGHQLGGDLCEWLPQARAFARRGYQALAFDFAGFGHSQHGSAHDRVDTDVVAAAEQLRRRGADRIVLVGSSMGGTAVLSAATRIRPPVAGVVSLSGPSGFDGVDARAAMRRLRVPVLLVVGGGDRPVNAPARVGLALPLPPPPPPRPFNAQARTLYAAARFRDKRLLVVPGRVHGTGMLELGDEAPKVLAAVRGFIDDRTGH